MASGETHGGRSGNDFLARGGEAYESWGAEGPSGAAAEGGYPGDDRFGGAVSRSRAPSGTVAASGERSGGSGLLTLLVGAGIGAALMYFLDAEKGADRRRMIGDKLSDALGRGREAVGSAASSVRERVGGNGDSPAPLAAVEDSLSADTLEQPM